MPNIKLHRNSEIKTSSYETGQNLMQIIQAQGIDISAPCGGNGTCGKCRVKVKNVGTINSCTYWPDKDIEVILPNRIESRILTHQHTNTLKLPLEPSPLAQSLTYPIGIAIDIGTTSIVFYWISLITGSIITNVGIINPQVKYGADVISRINFTCNKNGLITLQRELIDAINKQISDFSISESIAIENIAKISVSANTTMLHLLAGVNPLPIALAPFNAPFTESKIFKSDDLGILAHQEAHIELLPSISAYVGADIVSGLAALQPPAAIKNYLFIDIGTNGEMALVTQDQIYCCATAAGPAFEGANIFCGMGAFDGAISIYNENGYQTISDEKPIGICGSGLLDIVAYLLEKGVLTSDGELHEDYVVASKDASGKGEAIVITPTDIREVQLAKSAVYTGIKLLMLEANMSFEQLDAVYLAGGFGNYLNPESATTIGLLPQEVKGKIITVGNTSGAGAVLHTLSPKFSNYTLSIIEKSKLIELANHPEFEMEFAMNMYF